MNEWTDYAKSRHYAPLISWKDFIKTSPKKLILVHHTWSTKDCDETMVASTKEFVTNNSFTVVKRVCLNFRDLGLLSPVKFQQTIYGKMFKPSEVVVIFNRWGGIVHRVLDYRISLKHTTCHRDEEPCLWHHSQQLSNDVKEYARRYMNETTQYVAVMVRVEYFAIYNNLRNLSADVQRSKLIESFISIDHKVRSLKQQRNINSTLLTSRQAEFAASSFCMIAMYPGTLNRATLSNEPSHMSWVNDLPNINSKNSGTALFKTSMSITGLFPDRK